MKRQNFKGENYLGIFRIKFGNIKIGLPNFARGAQIVKVWITSYKDDLVLTDDENAI